MLKPLGQGQGYLKMGLLGFAGSGKTYTAVMMAIGVREYFGLEKPIAMFDSEGGSEYVAPMVAQCTGKELLGIKSRSFDRLMETAKDAQQEASVLIVDSITHPWRELCDAYLKQVNAQRKANRSRPKTRLEFQDWNIVKPIWDRWTTFYLNSPLHIIICGRAGYEYDWQQNEETDKTELRKTGVKMKTESEFGFEPSLLMQMERVQEERNHKFLMFREATVLKDRFSVLDGKSCRNPTVKFIQPHLDLLKPGACAPIDTEVKTDCGVDENGEDGARREMRAREILCEEIAEFLRKNFTGQTEAMKVARADMIEKHLGTRSWSAVEATHSSKLREALKAMRGHETKEGEQNNAV